jgi:adenine/guanine/hypoxanthine permease
LKTAAFFSRAAPRICPPGVFRHHPDELVRGLRYFRDVPGGLIAIAAGTVIAWGSDLFGLGYGGLNVSSVGDALSHFGFSFPAPAVGHVFAGFKFIGIILVTAIRFALPDG